MDLLSATEAALSRIRGKKISVVFQDPMTALNPSMTVGAQITEVLFQHATIGRAAARARAVDLLRLVGIPQPEERFGQYPHQFSGGMRQRIVIAIAIANNPAILLADEPTTALDVTIQSQIIQLIRRIRADFGMSMILITHDLGLVAGIADRILVMYAGRIVEEGATEQIFYEPQHPYTWGFSVPCRTLQNDDAPLRTIEGTPPPLIDPPKGCAFASRCPYRMRICRVELPPYFEPIRRNRSACWLHDDQAATQRATFVAARRVVTPHPHLSLRGLSRHFTVSGGRTVRAVENVDLDIARGETFGLVGESGCGKSTLGRTIKGIHRPTAGTVSIRRRRRNASRSFGRSRLCAPHADDLSGSVFVPQSAHDSARADRRGT